MRISQVPKFEPGTRCALCGDPAVDLDHALFPKPSGKRNTKAWKDFLENDFNKQPACANCNRWTRRADRYRERFNHVFRMMLLQPTAFKEWLDTYPGKRLGRWEEIDRMVRTIERRK